LLALGITPVLASRAADPSLYMTSAELEQMRRGYVAKLLSPKAWGRLLTFQSDYKVIWRAVAHGLRDKRTPAEETTDTPTPENDNANPLFPPAFFRMLESRRPMLLVFGGSDRLHWELDEKFIARHRGRLAALPSLYDVHIVKDANHVLSFDPWQREMLDVSVSWLRTHFARDVTAPQAPALAAAR
jgi:fermentation-respiration switch protein FrsA (DUF1100 family)